eukprot:37330_1
MEYKILYLIQENKMNELKKLNEKFRLALCACRDLAGLPSRDLLIIEWAKPNPYDNFTERSLECDIKKQLIQSKIKYKNAIENGEFIIENNPNSNCIYNKSICNDIKEYFEHNREGNINPWIKYYELRLNNIINIKCIENCSWQQQLNGQMETYSLINIEKGIILGQYCGKEMLKDEFYKIYNGTMEESYHFSFLHGDCLFVPLFIENNNNINEPPRKKRKYNGNNKMKGEIYEIFIDAADNQKSRLIFINDGRRDINSRNECLIGKDDKRINCEFISVLVNGY